MAQECRASEGLQEPLGQLGLQVLLVPLGFKVPLDRTVHRVELVLLAILGLMEC